MSNRTRRVSTLYIRLSQISNVPFHTHQMSSTLPSLCNLPVDCPFEATDASWAWDRRKYAVSFSMDTAIEERIDGLHDDTPRRWQLSPFQILHLLQEYTVQRLWDLHCSCPRLPDMSQHDEAVPWHPPDAEEPHPESRKHLLEMVATWIVGVERTLTCNERSTQQRRQAIGKVETDPSEVDNTAAMEALVRLQGALSKAELEKGDNEQALYVILTDLIKMISTSKKLGADHIKDWIIKEKDRLIYPKMDTIRRAPSATWHERNARSSRLMRWWKLQIMCNDGDENVLGYRDRTFKASAIVPPTIHGTFYTGDLLNYRSVNVEDRLDMLTMEHVIPISHMETCRLIKECPHPEHLSMLTVFDQGGVNSSRGASFLPLGVTDTITRQMKLSKDVFNGVSTTAFSFPRRCIASRIVCAGYLTLPMLESKPDAHTVLGPKEGGFYHRHFDSIIKLAQSTNMPNERVNINQPNTYTNLARQFRQEWMWEVGLSILQWFYLDQPYNPLPMMAYQKRFDKDAYKDAKFEEFTLLCNELLRVRMRGSDMMAELMRREMDEEVPGAPLYGDDFSYMHISGENAKSLLRDTQPPTVSERQFKKARLEYAESAEMGIEPGSQ